MKIPHNFAKKNLDNNCMKA